LAQLATIPRAISAAPATLVAGDNLSRRFGEGDVAVDALRDVSADFHQGTFTAVTGPSGSGKSALMHILAGLDTPTSGHVFIDGVEATALGDKKLILLMLLLSREILGAGRTRSSPPPFSLPSLLWARSVMIPAWSGEPSGNRYSVTSILKAPLRSATALP
jgi:energy-coupling factor transporter ATP-binding protein EcfA2